MSAVRVPRCKWWTTSDSMKTVHLLSSLQDGEHPGRESRILVYMEMRASQPALREMIRYPPRSACSCSKSTTTAVVDAHVL